MSSNRLVEDVASIPMLWYYCYILIVGGKCQVTWRQQGTVMHPEELTSTVTYWRNNMIGEIAPQQGFVEELSASSMVSAWMVRLLKYIALLSWGPSETARLPQKALQTTASLQKSLQY